MPTTNTAIRPAPERGSIEDHRRVIERLIRTIDSLNDRLDLLETVDRIAGDTTLTAANHHVFVDTDGGAVTITLPAGVSGKYYRIVNTGSSTNNLTITPDGTELLIGANSNFTLLDGETLIIVFDPTEGWY